MKFIVNNLQTICLETSEGYKLYEGLVLPSEICEPLIETYQNIGEVNDVFVRLFEDIDKTKLFSVHICNSTITDDGLEHLLRHNLYELSLTNCQYLTQRTYTNIFKYSGNLRSLFIGPSVRITPNALTGNPHTFDDLPKSINSKAPNLKHLVLRAILESSSHPHGIEKPFLGNMLDDLLQLRVLDLSHCLAIGSLKNLCQLTNLHTLILFNVHDLQNHGAIPYICSLKTLV